MENNLSTHKKITTRTMVVSLVTIVVVVAFGFGIWFINVQPQVSVAPLRVKAGGYFTLTQTHYRKDFARWKSMSNLEVFNDHGENIVREDKDVAQLSNLSIGTLYERARDPRQKETVRNTLKTHAGIVRKELLDYGMSTSTFLIDELPACNSIGLGYKPTRPWDKFEQVFSVLPATPPGKYTVRITKDYYCDPWGPTGEFTLTVIP